MLQQHQESEIQPVRVLQTTETRDVQEDHSYLTATRSSVSEVHLVAFSTTVHKNIRRIRTLRRIIRYLTGLLTTCSILMVFAALTGIIPGYYFFGSALPYLIGLIFYIPLELLVIQAGKRIAQQDDPRLVAPLLDAWLELGQNARSLNLGSRQIETALTRLLPRMTPMTARHLTKDNREQIRSFLLRGDKGDSRGLRERSIQLKLAMLQALEQVGTQEDIKSVSNMANSDADPRLRQAALECLPYLETRKEESEASQTLLRSSSAQETADPHLLRPACDIGVANDDLLRPI